MDMDLARPADKISRCAHVIFHVARAQHAARVHIFEAGKNFRRVSAHNIQHHIETAAMAHAQHRFNGAVFGG